MGWLACEFPKEADEAAVDNAMVAVRVEIGKDGRAIRAEVVGHDPGYGFGAAAVDCAMRQHYIAARDRAGAPAVAAMDIQVRFSRPAPKEGPP
jgi:hypothetical protein